MRLASAKLETVEPTVPVEQTRRRYNWLAALESGFISGALLLLLPQGIPWSAQNAFSGAIMGRTMGPAGFHIGSAALHMGLAVAYGLLIGAAVRGIRSWRALPAGAAAGLGLYCLNVAVVALAAPQWTGEELPVAITHLLFGLFAAAAYAGLTQRKRTS